MKKSTKGALAASAAAVLLLGGAGSLAYWTAEDTADGGTITAGDLKLTDGDCADDWTYATGAASAGDPVVLFVPGDQITTTCTFTLQASGDNLEATLDVPDTFTFTGTPAGTSFDADVSASFATSGAGTPRTLADGDSVTSADDGATITATFLVDIPFGTDETGTPKINANDTQDLVAQLDALTVTLTQVDPN